MWGKFSLSEVKSIEEDFPEMEAISIETKGQSCLVGKLLSERVIRKETIRSTFIRALRPSGYVSFRVVD